MQPTATIAGVDFVSDQVYNLGDKQVNLFFDGSQGGTSTIDGLSSVKDKWEFNKNALSLSSKTAWKGTKDYTAYIEDDRNIDEGTVLYDGTKVKSITFKKEIHWEHDENSNQNLITITDYGSGFTIDSPITYATLEDFWNWQQTHGTTTFKYDDINWVDNKPPVNTTSVSQFLQTAEGKKYFTANWYDNPTGDNVLPDLSLSDAASTPSNSTSSSANSSNNTASTGSTNTLSNSSYPTYNVTNTYAKSLISDSITGSTATLSKNSYDYKFYNLGGGHYGIQEKGSTKIDEITGASSLKFTDQTLTLASDVAATFNQVKGKDDVTGVVFRLYNAAFSRLPDSNGLKNWINGNTSGNQTYASSAKAFAASQEFINRYGSNTTDTQYITTLYNNVLERSPDASGLAHYQSLLSSGSKSRGDLLLDFSESPENRVLFTKTTGLA